MIQSQDEYLNQIKIIATTGNLRQKNRTQKLSSIIKTQNIKKIIELME
jgi:hypothetical protein